MIMLMMIGLPEGTCKGGKSKEEGNGRTKQQNLIRELSMTQRFILFFHSIYDSLSDVGEIRVYQRADFQSGSRVLKKVF